MDWAIFTLAPSCFMLRYWYYVETSKVNNLYSIIIRYFLLMFLMLLITGIWLLLLHTTFNFTDFTNYYVEKSLFGALEIVVPHLFAMGMVIFILTHFLSLRKKNTYLESHLSSLLFLATILLNVSLFFITANTTLIAGVKLFSTLAFLLLSLFISWKVLKKT